MLIVVAFLMQSCTIVTLMFGLQLCEHIHHASQEKVSVGALNYFSTCSVKSIPKGTCQVSECTEKETSFLIFILF